jgi:hypothetical protein
MTSATMTSAAPHATPSWRRVVMAQLRLLGSALRGPALVAAGLAVPATLLLIEFSPVDGVINFRPERQELLFGGLGLLAATGIWFGDERIGSGFLWTLPVDRRSHALARVFAGWVWLMGVVMLSVLWLLAISVSTGGSVMAEESLRLIASPARALSFSAGDTLDAGVVQTVQWTPTPIFWLVPFAAATAVYLIASAMTLGLRQPVRWAAGIILAVYLVAGLGQDLYANWPATPPGRVLRGVFDGRYGLDALLTARTGSLKTEATLTTGERVVVWRALPDLGHWAMATLLWTGAGLMALLAAASRHRERR